MNRAKTTAKSAEAAKNAEKILGGLGDDIMHSEHHQDGYVDDEMEPNPHLNELTNAIIGAAIEVHRTLGPGFMEAVYEAALDIEFKLRGIPFQRQVDLVIQYKGQFVGKGTVDFIVGGVVLLDLKAIEQLGPLQTAQMISYLSASGHPLGLLLNFNVRFLKDGIKRIANTKTRKQS